MTASTVRTLLAMTLLMTIACAEPAADHLTRTPPTRRLPEPPSSRYRAVALEADLDGACALAPAGRVLCWGNNEHQLLGPGIGSHSLAPIAVRGLDSITAIAVAGGHACALAGDGRLRCWGHNATGALGDGTREHRATPSEVVDLGPVTEFDTGDRVTCALRPTNELLCWGHSSGGLFGMLEGELFLRPVGVARLQGAERILLGGRHACVLMHDGELWCWGNNRDGQVIPGGPEQVRVPTRVTHVDSPRDVALGYNTTCAIRQDGTVACWGNPANGSLGAPGGRGHSVRTVVGISDALDIDSDGFHSCVLTSDAVLYCWGRPSSRFPEDWRAQRYELDCTRDRKPDVRPESVAVGSEHVCVLFDDGAVDCAGTYALSSVSVPQVEELPSRLRRVPGF